MTRAIPQAAIALIKDREETHLFVYDDKHYPPKPVKPGDKIDGTLTAGTGHTGPDVVAGMKVTGKMDAAWLLSDLAIAANRIEARIGAAIVADLTDNQYASLLDFVFNMGANPAWTIWKRLKAKKFSLVPAELKRFVNWGDPPQISSDLVDRRNADIALWNDGEAAAPSSTPAPSSVTRATLTPPTPSDPKPLAKKASLIAGAISAAAGAAPVAKAVTDGASSITKQIAPFAEHSEYVQQMVGLLSLIAAVGVTATFGLMWLEHRNAQN
jgi:lysozyme